ncbi:hypothetical protein ACSBR2_004601 [Camellia fascicularis]
MAWGFIEAALGGGVWKEEETLLVRVPMKAPMAVPWVALVVVTTTASTGNDCLANHALNPASNSLNLACN